MDLGLRVTIRWPGLIGAAWVTGKGEQTAACTGNSPELGESAARVDGFACFLAMEKARKTRNLFWGFMANLRRRWRPATAHSGSATSVRPCERLGAREKVGAAREGLLPPYHGQRRGRGGGEGTRRRRQKSKASESLRELEVGAEVEEGARARVYMIYRATRKG